MVLGFAAFVGIGGVLCTRVWEWHLNRQYERGRDAEAVFEVELDPELLDALLCAVRDEDRPASQVVRQMMRDYVAGHR